MKTVPSLVATSTIGIAAVGLSLGTSSPSTLDRADSRQRKAINFVTHDQSREPSATRPATSYNTPPRKRTPSRSDSRARNPPGTIPRAAARAGESVNIRGRRLSFVRYGEPSSWDRGTEEARRDSISSRSSWIKRLSTIPISQSNSTRSSVVVPDSPSLGRVDGSIGPLSPHLDNAAPLPPNKLVKRSTSGREIAGHRPRSRSRPQVPTLRRPATSHQRSATLHQQYHEGKTAGEGTEEEGPVPLAQLLETATQRRPSITHQHRPPLAWRPFFDSRPTRLIKEPPAAGKLSDGSSHSFYPQSRRILPIELAKPTLVASTMISAASRDSEMPHAGALVGDMGEDGSVPDIEVPLTSTETQHEESQSRIRRSVSLHFPSASTWLPRATNKRTAESRSGRVRYSSAPVSASTRRATVSAHGPPNERSKEIDAPASQRYQLTEATILDEPTEQTTQTRNRDTASPLPPISRLSSFNLDLPRLSLLSSPSSAHLPNPGTPHQPSSVSAMTLSSPGQSSPLDSSYISSMTSSTSSKHPANLENSERTSTIIGSDSELRNFASSDDDDTDFQSETIFDSLRSGATGSQRSRNTALDSLFDESPPSITGQKSKRLSLHELIGGSLLEGSDRIMEEDEGVPTPIKSVSQLEMEDMRTPTKEFTNAHHLSHTPSTTGLDVEEDWDIPESRTAPADFPELPSSFLLSNRDFSRLSLDDDDDEEDWTKEDDYFDVQNQLSPPRSMNNSRRVSPSFYSPPTHIEALRNTFKPDAAAISNERSKSSLFDWSEPVTEKTDILGNAPRPKTARVDADGRGGRAGRKGPTASHIRSQSVPVVPDSTSQREHTKATPKFGTWGLGAKGVSEDWGDDFDFDSDGEAGADIDHAGAPKVFVPAAIQACQANVVGHVGQIREFCLQVEHLKRLRILAREKDLLDGDSRDLWKEAEGVIALAIPDEEDPLLTTSLSPTSTEFGFETLDEGFEFSEGAGPSEVAESQPRRRNSVFSPDDDIFGIPETMADASSTGDKKSADVAQSILENIQQQRSTSDLPTTTPTKRPQQKMLFDTTSLKHLVARAGVLTRLLSEIIRKADGSIDSLHNSPARDSSPAFTRVFTDPMASPPKNLPKSQSSKSVLSGVDDSPSRKLSQRLQMMTVV